MNWSKRLLKKRSWKIQALVVEPTKRDVNPIHQEKKACILSVTERCSKYRRQVPIQSKNQERSLEEITPFVCIDRMRETLERTKRYNKQIWSWRVRGVDFRVSRPFSSDT